MHCPFCDGDHPDGTKFCPETGKRLKRVEPAAKPKQETPGGAKTISVNLSSPVTLIVLGTVFVALILMVVLAFQRNRQPAAPVATQDIPATLAAIISLTETAQANLPAPATATATMTMLPPTPTFTVSAPTAYILPTRTPMAGAYSACPNAYFSVLHAGDVAMVSTDPPVENNIRDKPSTESPITGTLEPGERVNLTGGPQCMGGYVWWRITSRSSGRSGWTAEGDWNEYWLIKVVE
jgi:hypothetical protein